MGDLSQFEVSLNYTRHRGRGGGGGDAEGGDVEGGGAEGGESAEGGPDLRELRVAELRRRALILFFLPALVASLLLGRFAAIECRIHELVNLPDDSRVRGAGLHSDL